MQVEKGALFCFVFCFSRYQGPRYSDSVEWVPPLFFGAPGWSQLRSPQVVVEKCVHCYRELAHKRYHGGLIVSSIPYKGLKFHQRWFLFFVFIMALAHKYELNLTLSQSKKRGILRSSFCLSRTTTPIAHHQVPRLLHIWEKAAKNI